jgi:hypothetical protein
VLLAITAPITNMMLVLFVLVLIILYVRVKWAVSIKDIGNTNACISQSADVDIKLYAKNNKIIIIAL